MEDDTGRGSSFNCLYEYVDRLSASEIFSRIDSALLSFLKKHELHYSQVEIYLSQKLIDQLSEQFGVCDADYVLRNKFTMWRGCRINVKKLDRAVIIESARHVLLFDVDIYYWAGIYRNIEKN